MWRMFFLSSLLTATTHAVPTNSEDFDGKEDNQCSENTDCAPGNFCYTETRRCARCIDCASRFRHNGDWRCHQEASDCGDCLPGYVEPSLERNTKKESCMPQIPGLITTSKTSSSSSSGSENMTDMMSTLGVLMVSSFVVLMSISLVVTLLYHLRKGRRTPPVQPSTELQELVSPDSNQPPPPYSPYAAYKSQPVLDPSPTAPFDATVMVNSPRDCATNIEVQTHPQTVVPAVEHDYLVQTTLFNHPNWVNARNYTGDQTPPTSPPQSPPLSPPLSDGSAENSIEIQDETTQPSDWTPNTSGNTSQENVGESVNQQAALEDHPPTHVGSTAIGTIPEIANQTLSQELSWREHGEEDLASSQESNGSEGPKQKKMRSESPPPATRNFPPGVFLTQQNSIANHSVVHNIHTASIQINLNLNREDRNSDSPSSSPNMLLDSEDFMT